MEKVELVKQPMNRNINKNHQFDEGTYMYKNNCYELFAGSISNRMPYAMLDSAAHCICRLYKLEGDMKYQQNQDTRRL